MEMEEDIVREFLVESLENLDRLDTDFVALEKDPSDAALLANIFRCIHTIKGTCGFLGFSKLEYVTHAGESLLSLLRDGTRKLDPEITTALLALVDAVRSILGHIDSASGEGDTDFSGLVARLERLHRGGDNAPAVSIPSLVPVATEVEPKAPAETTIRVDVGLLDRLMNLVGELVLARNQVLQYSAARRDPIIHAASQRLDLITSELQEGVMKARMQPIGSVWRKFPRVARDLAITCGKRVRIQMEGEDTELDRTIIEAIKDPLTHLLRNAIDHGIETPQERVAAGKPAEGVLYLSAYHEGGQVNIEIRDDGRGIDSDRVLQKAIQRGLIGSTQAALLSTSEILEFIFLPGFSTADKVTNVSGRGVGMDVVRANIEKIGGTTHIKSERGRGSTLKIRIPLTLAIIPALIVTCDGDRYALPQARLLELLRLDAEDMRQIENVLGVSVYRLRGDLVPLVDLRQLLGLPPPAHPPEAKQVVVLQAEDRRFALVVDEIVDTEEIVVKPLGKQLKSVIVYSGATIMGDGKVALILDVSGLAQQAGFSSDPMELRPAEIAPASKAAPARAMLVFGAGPSRRVAIPLEVVSRLEELEARCIERAGDSEVIQYRGGLLPLIRMSELLGERPQPKPGPLQVVVCGHESTSVGLVVDRIVDIVEEEVVLHRRSGRAGVMGSAVLQGAVTDIMDLEATLRAAGVTTFEAMPWVEAA